MNTLTRHATLFLAVAVCGISFADCSGAETVKAEATPYEQAVAKGLDYLNKNAQPDGGFSTRLGPGITGLAATAMLRHDVERDDPIVAKALQFMQGCVQENGSITMVKPGTTNYDTSIGLECFVAANDDGRYDEIVAGAVDFLTHVQRDEEEERKPSDADYGGLGYHAKTPGGDLSNTHMMLDAIESAGVKPDVPAVEKSLIFVSRCQNLASEHNTLEFAAKVNDGGFYYSPCHTGYGAAGKAAEGGVKSYASMTFCGLKCMLYAGLTPDDPRVQAAIKWLQKNYSVDSNAGLGTSGQYYHFYVMARTLAALGSPTFEDANGVKHDWRKELTEELIKRQNPDGSWTNKDNRWYENDPNLATSFALLALSYCEPQKQ
ncbi:prenyltransferase/squalene oxidase repeat-containing protein [Lacipirellula parvula]|uniref:Squalene cyclase C-terminal domain-containing protein n=1 Tax=Lacipirellula parvula TaxID=2650471 RepID=A0A5K7X6C1_9BACT|nr:prenyltransferase/squalene oxidase repeat-containing protein [Lacipirellula parvula]BBO32078.1 hypothetical protein PLANPX_1690 [Lacipirellula parvula]